MASRSIEPSEDRLSVEAPIWRWVREHGTAQDFDRNGSVVSPIRDDNPYVREKVSQPELLPMADHSPVPTLEETWASRPYEEPQSHVAETVHEIEDNLERDNDKGIKLGLLLTRLRMNTIDRAALSTLDKLCQFGQGLAQEAKPIERNEQGEHRLRNRTKIFLGAVAIAGVAYASERLGVVHQAQHLVHEAYSGAHGVIVQTHEHSTHSANVVHHHIASKTVQHTQTVTENTKSVAHQATQHAHRVAKHFNHQFEKLRFAGDTIWYHAQTKLQSALGHKPSTAELNSYVNRTLKLNHLNWESAKHMVKGQTFRLPTLRR